MYKTYDEWLEFGYCVMKGERSHKRNKLTNKPLFHIDQVTETFSDEVDYEADFEQWELFGKF